MNLKKEMLGNGFKAITPTIELGEAHISVASAIEIAKQYAEDHRCCKCDWLDLETGAQLCQNPDVGVWNLAKVDITNWGCIKFTPLPNGEKNETNRF